MDTLMLLNESGLRRTASRTIILDIFLRQNKSALSENDLEHEINGLCDRATIYRTLKTFVDKGLLHKVMDENNLIKYALCNHDQCNEHTHNHNHVHFKCKVCGQTTCMEHIDIQPVELPEGYTIKEANFLVVGTCKVCNEL